MIRHINVRTVTRALVQQFRLDRPGEWRFDADACTLTWHFDDGEIIAAEAQLLGTWAERASSFKWGWATGREMGFETPAAIAAFEYGQRNGISALTDALFVCEQARADQLAAFAAVEGGLHALRCDQTAPGLWAFTGFDISAQAGDSA